jgi:phasin family protein
MFTVDQIVSFHKANFDTAFGLSSKAFAGAEKLVELNVAASKAALQDAAANAKAALSVKDAQELLALQASVLQPTAEKALSYGRHVYDIASSTGAQFGAAYEAQVAAAQAQYASLIDNIAKNAPAGSETAVAVLKSAVAASGNAYEAAQKAFKQAQELVEQNMAAVSNTAAQTVSQTTRSGKKR